jgi:glycosyltransferase involved in cell wall biosynthesis
MHILFVTAEYPPLPGGVGAYTAELGRALLEQGCQVSVLTGRGVGVDRGKTTVPVYAAIARWDWRVWWQVAHWVHRVEADWVHVQYQTGAFAMHPAINFAPRLWRNLAGGRHRRFINLAGERQGRVMKLAGERCRRVIKIAWTYHDLLPPYLFPKAGNKLRRWVTEYPATVCDLVIVTNEGDRLQLAGKTSKLANIPIGSNIEGTTFTPAERQARRQVRGYGDSDLVIGYFGFLNRSKGGLTLVHTLERLVQAGHNARLLMVGERVGVNDPTNFQYLQEVEAQIHHLGLTDRVHWTGHQPAAEVSADLAACDLLLLPYEDGASLRRGTLMAGLAHGCAIITTTPQSPLPELVDGRDLLYVSPGDDEAAAQAVLRIVNDLHLAARLSANALEQSRQFSWTTIAAQHLKLYDG